MLHCPLRSCFNASRRLEGGKRKSSSVTAAWSCVRRIATRLRISHVVKGTRPVTAELALLFGRAFGQSPQYWLNLQAAYDLKTAQKEIGGRLRAVRPLEHA